MITEYLLIAARGIVCDWCLRDGHYDLNDAMQRYIARLLPFYAINRVIINVSPFASLWPPEQRLFVDPIQTLLPFNSTFPSFCELAGLILSLLLSMLNQFH